MPFPEPDLTQKLVRRHAHDVRSHCSGIDFDAALLEELTEDPEISEVARRLKNHVARIEMDLKFLLLKLEEPTPVTVTVRELLQLWQMKLKPITPPGSSIEWPSGTSNPSVTLDSLLVVQMLCDLTARAWGRNGKTPLQVTLHQEPERVVIVLVEPTHGLRPNAEHIGESAALLAARGLHLEAVLREEDGCWVTALAIPL